MWGLGGLRIRLPAERLGAKPPILGPIVPEPEGKTSVTLHIRGPSRRSPKVEGGSDTQEAANRNLPGGPSVFWVLGLYIGSTSLGSTDQVLGAAVTGMSWGARVLSSSELPFLRFSGVSFE